MAAQIHGGFPPQGVMPPNAHMGHMPTPGPNMHPSGQMHPQMHPGMRGPGMQHPGQNGPMMGHPSMGMTPNGMNAHSMGHMQPGQHPGMYGGHPQMGHSFQQMPQGGGMTAQQQQQAIMQQRARIQMQQNNPGMMMNGGQGPQMSGHPGMMKAPLPPHQMQQMRMQHAAQQQMANQNMHGGHPNAMQRQPSVQGLREQGPGAPQQHHGQQHPQTSMPPPTPHNTQMQRRPPGQPGPPPQHNQQQQPPHQQIAQNHQQPPQPLDQQAPPHHTPQPMHTPAPLGSGQPQHQPRPQQGPPQGQPPPQAGPSQGQMGQHQQQHPPQPQPARENEQQQRQNPPNMAQIRAQMHARQLNALNQQQQNLQMVQHTNTAMLAKLQAFCYQFNELAASTDRASLNAWQGLISDYFVPHGSFKKIVYNHTDQSSTVEHEVAAAALARYFWTFYAVSGVVKMQMALGAGNPQETAKHFRTMSDPFCSMTYYFPDGVHQVANGSMSVQLHPSAERMFSLEFINVSHEEFIPRQVLENMAYEDFKQSPEKSKTSAKHKQPRNGQRIISVANLPQSRCGEYGMPKGVQDFLEKADTLSRMRTIMDFHTQKAPSKRPREALDQLLAQSPNQQIGGADGLYAPQPLNPLANPNMQMPMLYGNGQGMMQAQQQPHANGPMRTPGLNGMPPNGNYFPSPANGHLGLPNHASPHIAHHTPPPGQHHGMQAPPMMTQGSQHGMGHSANGSSNASPNITGKRRRQSLAGKLEAGDEGMGPPPPAGGQNKVKQSPGPARPGKKQKGS